MLFKTELIYKIVAGEKTQTRRPVKDGDYQGFNWKNVAVCNAKGHARFIVGRPNGSEHYPASDKTYAVQPKRGQPCMQYGLLPMLMPIPSSKCNDDFIRIRITNIRREDVRLISHEDACAEGFKDRDDFLILWSKLYDPRNIVHVGDGVKTWDSFNLPVSARNPKLFDAWALTFEVAS